MKGNEMNVPTKQLARITGLFYLLIIFCGLYGGMVVRGAIVHPLDPNATLQQLIANESLYRTGFLGDLIMVVSDVMISVLFYFLLRPVHKGIATIATVFRLIQSAVLGANLINLFKPVLMIQGHENMDASQLGNLALEVSRQLQVFDFGYLISGVFFAINCLLMGYLIYKATIFPSFLGIMMTLAGFGYLFNCMANFLAPSLIETSEILMFFTAVVAELTFCLYLLIKGIQREFIENTQES